jgi:chromosome partitioning protein
MAARRVTGAGTGKPHIVVIGNEKGGSGKSTTAMHLTAGLMQAGYPVGTLDLDAGQGTFTRYVENRRNYNAAKGLKLKLPEHRRLEASDLDSLLEAKAVDGARLTAVLEELAQGGNAFIVIDTPGSDTPLSRLAHSRADTLITPLNDSYVDLDLLASVDPDTGRVRHPSRYAEMVWEQKKNRALRDGGSIDWIVMRNRVGTLESRNQKAIERTIRELSKRIGFRLAPGFSERVIFRELFLKGLTLLDLREPGAATKMNMSHIAARQEVRQLLQAIGLPMAG